MQSFGFLFQNACDKSSYCQNEATCQSGFTLKGYRCSCFPGFEGERCEKGISEILSDFQCWYDKFPLISESRVNFSLCVLC